MTPGSQHRIAVEAPRYGSVSLRSRLHKVELRRNSVLTLSPSPALHDQRGNANNDCPRNHIDQLEFGNQNVHGALSPGSLS